MTRPAPTPAPCGSWASPLTTEALVADVVRLASPSFGEDGDVYWIEGRPAEKGRNVLVRRDRNGRVEDLTPDPFNVRSLVHEYGGPSYVVVGERAFFINFSDQRVYVIERGKPPRALTDLNKFWRYADLTWDAQRARLLAIGEQHFTELEAKNSIVAIDARFGTVTTLVEGQDFYSAPRLSPDGTQLAYLAWDHPNMPWDAAALYVLPLNEHGRPAAKPRHVAGDARASVFQPGWLPDGSLVFAHEPAGFWRLHRQVRAMITPVLKAPPANAEFGLPLWQFGMAIWGRIGANELISAYTQDGSWKLVLASLKDGTHKQIATPWTSIGHVAADGAGRALLLAASATAPQAIVLLDSGGHSQVLRSSTKPVVDSSYVSVPEAVSFPTSANDTAHGVYHPPRNPNFTPMPGEKPPLIVMAHGGPTAATSAALASSIQFWTTRGFAVLDVNYRGSTGYGRRYRDRLNGQWGIFDVDDCVAGAKFLADTGRADGARLAIRGGSAGGFTVLAALAFRNVFRAGASHYGVSDLEALARDTHKFESRYLDGLVGPYPARKDLYVARSPVHAADRISCPVIFFQGLEDKIVPPNQSELMVAALRRKKIPVAYLAFEGEQHGFRKAETIKRAAEAELFFYGRIFNFTPAGTIEPVTIENL